jgi:dethiobiotin synthetase
MDGRGGTIADLGAELRARGVRAGFVVVATPGLGTLNHSALTAEALRHRGLDCVGFVLGSWPQEPDLAMRLNLEDLPAVTGVPLLGRVPDGAGSYDGARFQAEASAWLTIG